MINREKVHLEFSDDRDLLLEILGLYLEEHFQMIFDIKQAIERRDTEQLQMTAHTFRGAVSHFYCQELENQTMALEKMGQVGDFNDIEKIFSMFKNMAVRFEREVHSFYQEIQRAKQAA